MANFQSLLSIGRGLAAERGTFSPVPSPTVFLPLSVGKTELLSVLFPTLVGVGGTFTFPFKVLSPWEEGRLCEPNSQCT